MPTVVISRNTGADFSGVEDTFLEEVNPTTNRGSATFGETTKYDTGNHQHALLAFSGLANITGPVTVTAVTLELWQNSEFAGPHTISARRMLVSWTEAGATWNTRNGSTGWTAVGALGNGSDRSSTVSDAQSIGTATGQYYAWSSAQLIADVEDMINNGANHGWHFERTDGADDFGFNVWASSEGTDGQRPRLTVTYSAGGAAALDDQPWSPTERQTSPLNVSVW